MGFDGNGNYNRVHDWTDDATDNIKIRADRMDQDFDEIAAALSQVLVRDGQAPMTGLLNMGGNKISSLGDPSEDSHAIARGYADGRYHRRDNGYVELVHSNAANVNLSTEQNRYTYIRVLGSLSADRSITVAGNSRPLVIENATTGGFNINVIVGGQQVASILNRGIFSTYLVEGEGIAGTFSQVESLLIYDDIPELTLQESAGNEKYRIRHVSSRAQHECDPGAYLFAGANSGTDVASFSIRKFGSQKPVSLLNLHSSISLAGTETIITNLEMFETLILSFHAISGNSTGQFQIQFSTDQGATWHDVYEGTRVNVLGGTANTYSTWVALSASMTSAQRANGNVTVSNFNKNERSIITGNIALTDGSDTFISVGRVDGLFAFNAIRVRMTAGAFDTGTVEVSGVGG